MVVLVELEDQNGIKSIYSAGSSSNGLLGQGDQGESQEFTKISEVSFEKISMG